MSDLKEESKYKIVLLCLSVIFFWNVWAACACEIIVVRDEGIKPLNIIAHEFTDEVSCHTKEVNVSAFASPSKFEESIAGGKPSLLFAIGVQATALASRIDNVPVIFVAIDSQQNSALKGKSNMHAVRLEVSISKQLALIRHSIPNIRKIGVIYNPSVNKNAGDDAVAGAERNNVEVVLRRIWRPNEIAAALASLRGKVDALLLVADKTVLTGEGLELIGLFSLENRIPVIAFSEKYLSQGALMSISAAPGDVGRKAAKLAESLMAGEKVAGEYDVETPMVRINSMVAKQLDIRVIKGK